MLLCNRALQLIRHQRRPAVIDWGGAALLVCAVTAWLLLLSWGRHGDAVDVPDHPIARRSRSAAAGRADVARGPCGRDPILPPRLFANATFLRGVLIAFFASLAMFGATFLLPLYFQLVLGFDASTSGVLVVPYLGSTVIGAMVSGQLARRRGRVKAIVLIGLSLIVFGFVALVLMNARTSLWLVLPLHVFPGGRNRPDHADGADAGAERRGASGAWARPPGLCCSCAPWAARSASTIVGTLLAMRFSAGLHAAGVMQEIDLGSLRGGSAAFDSLSAGALAAARAALASGFRLGFLVCALLLLFALVIALGMRDLPLRSSGRSRKTLGH